MVGYNVKTPTRDRLTRPWIRPLPSVAPETLVVFGGQNCTIEDHRQEAWLRKHSRVDVYLVGESEQPFFQMVDLFPRTHSIETVKGSHVYGLHALVDGKLYKTARTRSDGY